jgi:hypothetical protein
MNVENIWRAFAYLEQEPRRLYMSEGITSVKHLKMKAILWSREERVLETPPCGTVCCLAGAAVLSRPEVEDRLKARMGKLNGEWWGLIEEEAEEIFDLGKLQSYRLFYLHRWPPHFREEYLRASTPEARLAALKEYIQFFIDIASVENIV